MPEPTERLNPYIQKGIEQLRTLWPQAHYERSDYGGYLIVVPSMKLPRGYKQTICTVLFIAPPGFPSAVPENFFTDIPIELAKSHKCYPWPKATVKEGNFPAKIWPAWEKAQWWSWHLQHWNPNHDSLYTYMRVVQHRLGLVI